MAHRTRRSLLASLVICFTFLFSFFLNAGNTPLEVRPEKGKAVLTGSQGVSDDAIEASTYDSAFQATVTQTMYTETSQSLTISLRYDTEKGENDFILGYYSEEYDYPLSAEYVVTTTEGKQETRQYTGTKSSRVNPYDGVGKTIGSNTFTLSIDILISPGERVDPHHVVLYNIFPKVADSTGFLPDVNHPLKVSEYQWATTAQENLSLIEYLDSEIVAMNEFSGFTSISVRFLNNSDELYKKMKASVYATNQMLIESGDIYFEYKFTSIASSFFRFYYEDGSSKDVSTNEGAIDSTLSLTSGEDTLRFVFAGISLDNLVGIGLCSANYSVRLMYASTQKEVVGSTYSTRFGSIFFRSPEDDFKNVPKTSIDISLVIAFVVVTVILVGATLGIYFYFKEKYKNDEFRRMDNKRFLKLAALSYLTIGGLVFDILFIVYRSTVFQNSLTVFNPFDNYIVVFSIALILLIGYFIRLFIDMIRDSLERKAAEKMKLNEFEKEDDGTK